MDLPTSFPENSSNFSVYDNPQTDECDVNEVYEVYEDWIFTVIPVYIYVISALGILFNLVVLLVFLLHKKACTVAEIYLSNMAAADFVLVFSLSFHAVSMSSEFRWPFGAHMCPIVYFCIKMNYNCSIFFLVLVSIDRYLALVHPLLQSKLRRRKYAKLNCVLVWIFGLLLGIPTLMYRQITEQEVPRPYNETFELKTLEYTCVFKFPNMNVYFAHEVIQTIVPFIIPMCIITFCTVKIVQALMNRPMEGSSTHRNEHKATVLVLVVLLVFLICWVPFHVVKMIELLMELEIIEKYCTLIKNVYICKVFFIYLSFFNSDLNPILYVLVGKNFRKKMWEVSRIGKLKAFLTESSNGVM